MKVLSATARWIAGNWVWLYTRGLPPGRRAERRLEIESDIWEQTHESSRMASAHALARCLAGIPADLSWRLEEARPGAAIAAVAAAGLGRVEAAAGWVGRNGLPRLVTMLAWLYIIGGALIVVALPVSGNPNPGGVAAFGVFCAASGGAMRWGHAAAARHPWRGAMAVLLGSVPLGIALWMTIVIPLLTAAVGWQAIHGARQVKAVGMWSRLIGSYLPILSRVPAFLKSWLARGAHFVTVNILAIGDALIRPAPPDARDPGRRAYVLKGAGAGLAVGLLARLWMRTISENPVFTPGGTMLILIVFSGLGALAGLSIAWRRFGTGRRKLLVRGAAWAPFVLMGPFMLLFLPGLGLALLRSHSQWGTWLRRIVAWTAWALLVFFTLVFLGTDRGPGLVAAGLYLVVAWAIYFTNRIALAPLAAGRRANARPWDGSKPNHSGSTA